MLFGAKACGFGPVAKMLAVARILGSRPKRFAGSGTSLMFARDNSDTFDSIEEFDFSLASQIPQSVATSDVAIAVMEEDLAFWCQAAGVPLFFIDSLLGFWQLDHSVESLVTEARKIGQLPLVEARAQFMSRSPHERKILCHVWAVRSFAQNFPGVQQRASELRELGCDILVCGATVDMDILAKLQGADFRAARSDSTTLLVNLGGFSNFLLDFEDNNAYVRMIERWILERNHRFPGIDSIEVYCGAYREPSEYVTDEGLRLRFLCVDQRSFLRKVATSRAYLCTPGITSIYEAALIGVLPQLLPEEHYGHIANVRALHGTFVGDSALRFADVIADYDVPEDDYEGTAAIVRYTESLLDSEASFEQVSSALDAVVWRNLAIERSRREAALMEMRQLMDGIQLSEVVGMIEDFVTSGKS